MLSSGWGSPRGPTSATVYDVVSSRIAQRPRRGPDLSCLVFMSFLIPCEIWDGLPEVFNGTGDI